MRSSPCSLSPRPHTRESRTAVRWQPLFVCAKLNGQRKTGLARIRTPRSLVQISARLVEVEVEDRLRLVEQIGHALAAKRNELVDYDRPKRHLLNLPLFR